MASVDVLFIGYADDRVAGTVSCVRDGGLVAIVDPGMVPDRSAILDPLLALGLTAADVTDVILSHHHPDHTINIALFANARVHDTWAMYEGDVWTDRAADGVQLSPGVRLMATPGHTAEDITTLVQTDDGAVALTHLWGDETSGSDPLAEDHEALDANRKRVLAIASLIVPAHGGPFAPGAKILPDDVPAGAVGLGNSEIGVTLDLRDETGISRRSFLARTGIVVAGVAGVAGLAATWAIGKAPSGPASRLGSPTGSSARPTATARSTDPAQPAGATWWVPSEDVALKRTWMAWPWARSIWGNGLSGVQDDIATLAKEIAKYNPVIMCADGTTNASTARVKCGTTVTVISSIPVNDAWMRDTGPLFRTNGAGGRDALGLNFNGWGNKQLSDKDMDVAGRVAAYAGVSPFATAAIVGEGGAVEFDGDGTLMATESSLLNANRNPGKTKTQIEAELLNRYGATKMIWLTGILGQDITDDHVDATSRFVRPGLVIVQVAPDNHSDAYAVDSREQFAILSNATDAKGRRLQVIKVDGPDQLPRIPASQQDTFVDSYVNWTVTNGAIITAQFGDPVKDASAKAAIGGAFPGKTVVQLNLDKLHGGGGGAHCVTMHEPLP